MKARYVVVAGLLLITVSVAATGALAQDADAWRASFAAGEQARQADDVAGYAAEMAAAAESMPEGHLNRPFVQYHAARAASLAGRSDEAIAWLRTAWHEDIESLMISFAPYDPAFESLIGTDAFRSVMSLAAEMELEVRRLGGRTHLIQGAGANVVAQVGPDGVLMVDTGYGPALPGLRAALASLGGGGSVDMLIVTHPHEDHMGATPELGVEASVLAHPGTTSQMGEPYVFMEGVSLPPKPVVALPDVEISRDTTVAFNGESIRLVPTVAHTVGDLSVYFEGSRVLHLGDTYLAGNPMMYPGTSDPQGFLDELDGFIDSLHPETVVVGGHEEPADLTAVRRQIEQSRACMAYVQGALADGLDIETTARNGAERFPPQWIAFFYQVLTQFGESG